MTARTRDIRTRQIIMDAYNEARLGFLVVDPQYRFLCDHVDARAFENCQKLASALRERAVETTWVGMSRDKKRRRFSSIATMPQCDRFEIVQPGDDESIFAKQVNNAFTNPCLIDHFTGRMTRVLLVGGVNSGACVQASAIGGINTIYYPAIEGLREKEEHMDVVVVHDATNSESTPAQYLSYLRQEFNKRPDGSYASESKPGTNRIHVISRVDDVIEFLDEAYALRYAA